MATLWPESLQLAQKAESQKPSYKYDYTKSRVFTQHGGLVLRAKYDKTSYWRDYFANDIPKDAAAGKTVAVTGATANGCGIWLAKHAALLGAKNVVLNRASPRSAAAEEEVRAFAKEHGCASEIHTVECDLSLSRRFGGAPRSSSGSARKTPMAVSTCSA